jgi:hypothetical protein
MMDVRNRRRGVLFNVGVLRHATNSFKDKDAMAPYACPLPKHELMIFFMYDITGYHATFMLPSAAIQVVLEPCNAGF